MTINAIHYQPEYRRMLTERAERLPEALETLDFEDHNQVIWFLEAVNEVGYAGTEPVPEMEKIFAAHGFYPGMNGIEEYDPNDERSFALYIIGKALLDNNTSKQDLIRWHAKYWRKEFNKPQPLPL